MLPAISDSCEIVCVIVVSYKLSGIFIKISHNVVHLYENIHIHNYLGSYLPTFTILYESFQCTFNLMMCNVLLFLYADMDSANIFIACDSRTLGLLVPSGTKYVDLVEIILAKMKINIGNAILKMEYDVGGNMAPLWVENDNSLFFYMELKRKDHRFTACVLSVEVDHEFNISANKSVNEIATTCLPIAPIMERLDA